MTAALLADRVEVVFDNFRALKGVSVEVQPGESFGLVGESGSGKSTLLRAIAGLAPIASGSISVNGKPLGRKRDKAFYRRVRETGTRPSEASLSEVTLSKPSDASSPQLFHYSTLRRPLRTAVIEHVYDRTTIRFTLSSVFISSLSMSVDGDDNGGDACEPVAPGTESLSLNYQQIEMSVVDKVRRPLALPQTTAFAGFNPHQGVGAGFPLPIELIIAIFSWLDQQSLSRASMVRSPA
jgi:ABC-type glutathione transport system ATPase component